MARRRYLVLLWGAGDEAAERAAMRHLGALEIGGAWRRTFVEGGWALALETDTALSVRRLMHGRGVVLGDLYPMNDAEAPPGPWVALSPDLTTSREIFHQLSRRFWGRYVALHQPAALEPVAAFRDPSGTIECLTWRRDRLRIVASHLPTELPDLRASGLGVDWAAVASRLGNAGALTSGVALTGLEALDAGEMMDLKTAERRMVWTPAAFVSRHREPKDILLERLRGRVDQVVGAHARQAGAIVAELSGGLDSAIVAGALQTTSPGKVAQWVNFHTADPEGDERRFARAVASHLGLSLTEVAKTELELTEARLDGVGTGLRPSSLGVDYEQDEDNGARCAAVGADTLITGMAGDAVFLQLRSPLIAADALRAGIRGRALFRVFHDVAEMRRASVWSVAWASMAGACRREPPRTLPPYLPKALVADVSHAPTHPWLSGLGTAPPCKQLQIRALAAALLFHGHSRRGLAVDLIHPLLSQPLVECVLGIATFDLAFGSNDRALAREAFADRLPPEVLHRRSKGDLLAYYGRMMSRSLGFVRPYLLDGLLVREGLVERAYLEEALTPESLLWRDLAIGLAELLAVEAWARRWQGAARG